MTSRKLLRLPFRPRICHLSGGVASWAAARRVIDAYGTDDVILLFADTKFESADLYKFLEACVKNLGARFIKLADGRDPWQVFKDERFLGNSRVDPCSRVLKRELLKTWVDQRWNPKEVTHYYGFDWTEEHRLAKLQPFVYPAKAVAPLCFPPFLDKKQIIEQARLAGLPISQNYELGFDHDNCDGRCVKAGQAHYARLLTIKPATYAEVESRENEMREMLGDVSILKDRRGGETKPMPLKVFRRLVGAGEWDKFDFGSCSCFMPASDPMENT